VYLFLNTHRAGPLDMDDELVRGCAVTHDGRVLFDTQP
jgi:NAD/NADP transhydrogenase alpha subunit